MSTTASMIYNICLLAVWVIFLWKNLTPRFSFRITMLICVVVVPAAVLGINYGLARLSLLRLISVPLLFLILVFAAGFFLGKKKPRRRTSEN